MRSISRLAVTAAALLVGATVLVASEESVRKLHVVEKPDDLVALYTDAQGIVTYDSVSGRFYFPSLGLYLDPTTSMFYDPDTRTYLDSTLRGGYSYSEMDGMYRNEDGVLCFDPAKRMSFYSDNNLYWTDGMFFVWDSQFNMLRDPISGDYYDRGLGAFMSYNAALDMFYDKNAEQYYDPALGLYYDEGMGMFFDPICGRFYDRDAQMYYDPDTGNTSLDADGAFHFDLSANAYYNEKDGCWYCYDDVTGLYVDQTSYGDMSMMMGMGQRYYDPDTEFHFIYDGWCYVVEETGDLYDPGSQCFYDTYNMSYYRYDSMAGGFVEAMSGMGYTPYWMETGRYVWGSSEGGGPDVDMSNMVYDYGMEMYYDNYYMLYYNADDGMYFDGMSYYREPWGDSYWYDSMSQCYVNGMTGEHYTPSHSNGPSSSKGVDLSSMSYDSMMDLYYDGKSGLYYDAKISMYTDFMCYYLKPWGDCYYYDCMQNAYICYMTGDVYYPHSQSVVTSGSQVQALTEEQIAEIQATFMALEYMMKLPSELDETETSPIETGTYSAAPFSFADALWFRDLLDDGMCIADKRIWLIPGTMPGSLEVRRSDPWATGGVEESQPTGLVVPVSESLWNRSTRTVTFILDAGWNSCATDGVSILHDCCSGIGYYDGMGNYTMTGIGMGVQELSNDDLAIYNRYLNDWEMLNFLVRATYGGSWTVSTMYGGVGMMSGVTITIGGFQDMDGDGLSDLDEIKYGTNPFMADTDGDGLNDALELRIGSCPTMYDEDSDYDGMADVWERYFGLNPDNPIDANADPDHDGLNNQRECLLGTNPLSMDTDGDGLKDGEEIKAGTQPCNPDTDNDQLPDGAEVARGTNPLNPDTDLDGLLDGREVGLGLDPLSVDTDCDGIADSDEVEYQLLGMSVAEKESSEIARRLRNWLPTDIEDLESDIDNDGTPDWVEYLGGFKPGDQADVFDGTDGFPAVFVMTVNVEAGRFARPVMLCCNGEKVCVNRSCSVKRYCREGEWHTLRVAGVQGSSVKVTVSYDDPRYTQHMVIADDPQAVNGSSLLPGDSCASQHVSREMRFCQPTVAIANEHICFHGTGENRQVKKTLTAEIVPEGFLGECSWWPGPDDIDSHDEKDEIGGDQVNITRGYAGSEVYCKVRFMMDDRLDGMSRVTHKRVTECVHRDTDAQQDEWCDVHNREAHICCENGIEDCSAMGVDCTKVEDLPKREVVGGTGSGDNPIHVVNEKENDYGIPYYVGTHSSESIPVNSDDDNGNGKEDRKETKCTVEGEDDLRPHMMLTDCDECCPCHGSASDMRFKKKNEKVKLWTDEKKEHAVSCVVHDKIYLEGVEPSSAPQDAGYTFEKKPKDPNGPIEVVERAFTVYSVHLQPDLNHDGQVDGKDAKLLPSMKSLGLGWCVIPEKVSALKLNVDVDMPGRVYVRISGSAGTANLYAPGSDTAYQMTNLDKCESVTLHDGKAGTLELSKNDQVLWLEVLDPKMSGTIEVVYEGTGDAEGYECHAKIKFRTFDFQIAGDGGVRDGKIKFDDPADKNITFWVNDDYDVIRRFEEDYQEDDNEELCKVNGTAIPNCDDDCIGMANGEKNVNYVSRFPFGKKHYCFRDLEDFDRLHLNVDDDLLRKENVVYKFRFVPSEGTLTPSINLFYAVAADDFYLRGVTEREFNGDYDKKNNSIPSKIALLKLQMESKRLMTVSSEWQQLDTESCTVEKFNKFLYEGAKVGTGLLEVQARYGDLVMAHTSLKMQLAEARDFTDVYKIPNDPLTDAVDGDEFLVKVPCMEPPVLSTVEYPKRNNKELVLLVLGWNVSDKEKYAWNDMVFKRLFWHGYRGRVGSLIWPCQGGIRNGIMGGIDAMEDPANFDRSEHRAWLSGVIAAEAFRKIVSDGTHLTLITHSQGNVLVNEALRRLTREERGNITYLAWQGAFSAQMYNSTIYDATVKGSPYSRRGSWFANLSNVCGGIASWWDSLDGNLGFDLFGHSPHGESNENPYMEGVLASLRYSHNFYNRGDYALDKWIGNHATRPDRLKNLPFGYTENAIKNCKIPQRNGPAIEVTLPAGRGRFYQTRSNGPMVIYPGNDKTVKGNEYELVYKDSQGLPVEGGETAKWCVFSFVAKSRSLAIGQIDMGGCLGKTRIWRQSSMTRVKKLRKSTMVLLHVITDIVTSSGLTSVSHGNFGTKSHRPLKNERC